MITAHISPALGKVVFSNFFVDLSSAAVTTVSAAKEAGIPVVAFGVFLNALVKFLIVALVLFLLIRAMNRMMEKPKPAWVPTSKDCPHSFSVIELCTALPVLHIAIAMTMQLGRIP